MSFCPLIGSRTHSTVFLDPLDDKGDKSKRSEKGQKGQESQKSTLEPPNNQFDPLT